MLAKSSFYETEPVGGPAGQAPYLNAVVLLETFLKHEDPRTLLAELMNIERRMGRERKERWGPRVIDLDLIDFGRRIFIGPRTETPGGTLPALRLPHPRVAQRAFVLAPLLELDLNWRHPTLGLSAGELLERVSASGVERLTTQW